MSPLGDKKIYSHFFKSQIKRILTDFPLSHFILTQPKQKILEDLEVVITEV